MAHVKECINQSTKVFAGCGVKGGTGGRMRSGAEGEHRTGEDDGRSRTLDSTGSAQPIAGVGQGLRPPCLPRSQSGKLGHGMQPKGLPKRSAELQDGCSNIPIAWVSDWSKRLLRCVTGENLG